MNLPRIPVSGSIPLYGDARFVAAALDGVLAQSVPAMGVIVADDSAETVPRCAATHALVLLRKPTWEQSSARSFGIRYPYGNLIVLLGQDDLSYSFHLDDILHPFLQKGGNPEIYLLADYVAPSHLCQILL
jgi:cellulose synthase/poly-beta-1,6-N-acetylglucosamine synthase-like glycosyltransferase